MPWGETISDYVNAQSDRRQNRKNDQWAKLMQIAQLGKGIWDTLNEQNKYKPGSDYFNFENSLAEAEATRNLTKEQKLQTSAAEIAERAASAGFGRQSSLGNEDFKRQMELEGMRERGANYRAGLSKSGQGISQEAWTAYDKAISAAQEKFLELDASGNVVLKKGVTPQILRDFLYAFADPQFVGKDNVNALKKLFDQWVLDPSMPGTPGVAPQQAPLDLPAIMKAIQELLASQKETNPNLNTEPPVLPKGGIETMDQPIAGKITAGMVLDPRAGWGAEFFKNREQERNENVAADELEKMYPGLSTEDKKMADWAIPELRKSGPSTNWKTIYATLQALRNKYKGSLSDIMRSNKK